MLVFILMQSSCAIPYDPPLGTWKSDNPEITLYIVSKKQDESTVVYVKDGEVRDVVVDFHIGKGFTIRNVDTSVYIEEQDRLTIQGDRWYFDGRFKAKKDGKLYYYARRSEGLGYQDEYEEMTIVFERVEEDDATD